MNLSYSKIFVFSAKIQISNLASIYQNRIFWQQIKFLPQCVLYSNRHFTFPLAVNFSLKSVMSLFLLFFPREAILGPLLKFQKFVDLWLSLFSHTFRQPWKSTLGILWLHRPFDPFGLQHSHQPQTSLKLRFSYPKYPQSIGNE